MTETASKRFKKNINILNMIFDTSYSVMIYVVGASSWGWLAFGVFIIMARSFDKFIRNEYNYKEESSKTNQTDSIWDKWRNNKFAIFLKSLILLCAVGSNARTRFISASKISNYLSIKILLSTWAALSCLYYLYPAFKHHIRSKKRNKNANPKFSMIVIAMDCAADIPFIYFSIKSIATFGLPRLLYYFLIVCAPLRIFESAVYSINYFIKDPQNMKAMKKRIASNHKPPRRKISSIILFAAGLSAFSNLFTKVFSTYLVCLGILRNKLAAALFAFTSSFVYMSRNVCNVFHASDNFHTFCQDKLPFKGVTNESTDDNSGTLCSRESYTNAGNR